MKKIDFGNSGGFPLTGDKTLDSMQQTYLQILEFVNAYLGIPKIGNYIVQGCELIGGNLTEGWMYIDGDIVHFPAVNAPIDGINTKFKKDLTLESVAFKNGSNHVVYSTPVIQQSPVGVPLSSYTRIGQKLGILAEGRVTIPLSVASFHSQQISFANINTAEYQVIGCVEQTTNDGIYNFIMWQIADPTPTGFTLILRGDNSVGSLANYFNYKVVKR